MKVDQGTETPVLHASFSRPQLHGYVFLFHFISFSLGGITPIDWDTGCDIFEGTFMAEK